jgi:hypothetical protein
MPLRLAPWSTVENQLTQHLARISMQLRPAWAGSAGAGVTAAAPAGGLAAGQAGSTPPTADPAHRKGQRGWVALPSRKMNP